MAHQPAIAGDVWFNSKPLAAGDLAGKIVLVDFWTYSCVNCLRTLPYLKRWWQKYKDINFILVGIHTPEFEFEKDPANVGRAIAELGITWPVVLDNDHVNWNNFANRYWPAKYLIDPSGRIVYTHFGEGGYRETELEIQRLIRGARPDAELPKFGEDGHTHGGVCFIPTPETYCGYLRGRLSNAGGYREDQVAEYQPPERLPTDSIALSGKFLARPEYVESTQPGAALELRFRGTEVNLVLRPADAEVAIEVTLDGKPFPGEIRGRDVDHSGVVRIGKPAMYNLLRAASPVEGTLGIRAVRGNFQAYALTFSGCLDTA